MLYKLIICIIVIVLTCITITIKINFEDIRKQEKIYYMKRSIELNKTFESINIHLDSINKELDNFDIIINRLDRIEYKIKELNKNEIQ